MKISFLLLCLSLLLFVCYFFFSVCMSGGVVSLFVYFLAAGFCLKVWDIRSRSMYAE